jgi:hypothetical protein
VVFTECNHRIEYLPPDTGWWVGFCDGHDQKVRRWCAPGWSHCFAFREVIPGVMEFANPSKHFLELSVILGSAYAWVEIYRHRGVPLVHVERPRGACSYPRHWLQLVTCATIVSYVLGLDRGYLFPRSLCRALVQRYGGTFLGSSRNDSAPCVSGAEFS